MKRLFILLFVLAMAVLIGLSLRAYPGLMMIKVASWRIDMPLWLGVVFIFLSYLLVHLLFRLITAILSIGEKLRALIKNYQESRAKRLTQKGLIAFVEGNYGKAEAALVQGAENSALPWINYLFAAQSAQVLDSQTRRDHYLSLAHELLPDNALAIGLTRAKLQAQHGQYSESLATLLPFYQKHPTQPALLIQLQELYVKLRDWESLATLFPQLKRFSVLPKEELWGLEQRVWLEILHHEKNNSLEALQAIWQRMPKYLRLQADIALLYATRLIAHHQMLDAEEVLRQAIEHEWREDLVARYGTIHHSAPKKMLSIAEGWLKTHPDSPALLLSLGSLCQQLELWGKAQRYFEASITLEPHPQAYAQLGMLLEKMHKPEQGAHYFKKGLLATPAVEPFAFDVARLPANEMD